MRKKICERKKWKTKQSHALLFRRHRDIHSSDRQTDIQTFIQQTCKDHNKKFEGTDMFMVDLKTIHQSKGKHKNKMLPKKLQKKVKATEKKKKRKISERNNQNQTQRL